MLIQARWNFRKGQVYVVDELLFSSSHDVQSAIARMKAEGAIFLTYKSLFYELVECIEDGLPLPHDLRDSAVQ